MFDGAEQRKIRIDQDTSFFALWPLDILCLADDGKSAALQTGIVYDATMTRSLCIYPIRDYLYCMGGILPEIMGLFFFC